MKNLQENSFTLFTPRKGFKISVEIVVYPLIIMSFLLFYFFDQIYPSYFWKSIAQKGLYLSFGLMIFFSFFRMFDYKSLHGSLKGALKFSADQIFAGTVIYKMEQIKKIELHFDDYHGLIHGSGKYGLNPMKSLGTGNSCVLTMLDGEVVRIFFQIYAKGEFNKMRDLMIEYQKQNKIHFLKLIEYLGMNDYDEIQLLKKKVQNN